MKRWDDPPSSSPAFIVASSWVGLIAVLRAASHPALRSTGGQVVLQARRGATVTEDGFTLRVNSISAMPRREAANEGLPEPAVAPRNVWAIVLDVEEPEGYDAIYTFAPTTRQGDEIERVNAHGRPERTPPFRSRLVFTSEATALRERSARLRLVSAIRPSEIENLRIVIHSCGRRM